MNHPRKQRTLSAPVRLTGYGYWSGQDVVVELRPAPAHAGIAFVRSDLTPHVRIPAGIAHRVVLPRRTALAVGGARVEMTEHLLAALAGLQIDNCEVWIGGPELPAFDGSSRIVAEAIEHVGSSIQAAWRATLRVMEPVRLNGQDSWIEAGPSSVPGLSIEYILDYGPGPIGRQTLRFHADPDSFRRELATARTFVLEEEAAWLRQQGLGTRVTYQDLLVFGPRGPLHNELRFDDECVRHKVLDLVGDLALAGCDIHGRVIAYRSGHRLNGDLVETLLNHGRQRRLESASA